MVKSNKKSTLTFKLEGILAYLARLLAPLWDHRMTYVPEKQFLQNQFFSMSSDAQALVR